MGITVFRFLLPVLLVTLGWSLWVVCVEGYTPDEVALSSPIESDCPPNTGIADCCITTQPFVAVKKVVVPCLELAGPLITTALFTLENLFLHLPIGPLDALPPSDKHSTYLAISILRV